MENKVLDAMQKAGKPVRPAPKRFVIHVMETKKIQK